LRPFTGKYILNGFIKGIGNFRKMNIIITEVDV